MKKIAVIDDDYNLRKLICNVIERELNMPVISFHPSLELLQIFRENKFDLVIIDYLMPQIDGLELVLNFINDNDKMPVILTTAYPDIEQVQVLKENSHKLNLKILKKPFSIDELVQLTVKSLAGSDEL